MTMIKHIYFQIEHYIQLKLNIDFTKYVVLYIYEKRNI